MSLGLMMRGNWDGLSMTAPQLQTYKPERPVYSTPHPVQSTPANNECKLVDLRGTEVASFIIADEEYICLPQAFDFFLKHLVGGLHTVYTKLKRLNITPVVCNVEQVRVLRGLGAIQPGVNRCKLITRRDFETLYQDCTTASRPGRPPKRYPILSPSELLPHQGHRSLNPPRGMLGPHDFSGFHKRMRLDHEAFHQQQARRMSTSPSRGSPPSARKYSSGADEMYANAANIYLQQALRHQYRQLITNGMHAGASSQRVPMNTATLAPLIGMPSPGLFNGPFPSNLLSHFNEYTRSSSRESRRSPTLNSDERENEKSSHHEDEVENTVKRQETEEKGNSGLHYEDRQLKTPSRGDSPSTSPQCRLESSARPSSQTSNSADGRRSVGVFSHESSNRRSLGDNKPFNRGSTTPDNTKVLDCAPLSNEEAKASHHVKVEAKVAHVADDCNVGWRQTPPGTPGPSSMQTLLSNIQGLLKVAADSAKLQDKQLSIEIANLKSRISREQELRGEVQRKLEESEKSRASIQKQLKKEREAVKRLQEQKLAGREKLQQNSENDKPTEEVTPTSPSEISSEPTSPASHSTRNLQIDAPGSVAPTPTPDCSPSASSLSSTNDCPSYWNARRSTTDIGSQDRNPSPESSSPVNMTTSERSWVPFNMVQSSWCAK